MHEHAHQRHFKNFIVSFTGVFPGSVDKSGAQHQISGLKWTGCVFEYKILVQLVAILKGFQSARCQIFYKHLFVLSHFLCAHHSLAGSAIVWPCFH